MLQPPSKGAFAGAKTTDKGIPSSMLTGQHFLEQMKEKCLFCHQVGSTRTRTIAPPDNSTTAWDARMQRWPQMHTESRRLGERGLKMLAKWTGDIAAGRTPQVKPMRPTGVERNVVITAIGWGDGVRLHDQTSSDRLAPMTNAGGNIYGMDTSEGILYLMDPKTTKTWTVPVAGLDGSPHDPRVGVHASEMDDKGRVWMVSDWSRTPQADWCSDGSTPSSKYFPLKGERYKVSTELPVYDPKTGKITNLQLCAGGNHGHFTFDHEKLYLTNDTSTVPWLNIKVWDETHDVKKALNWCPMVLDTSGDGCIDPDRRNWVEPDVDALSGTMGEYGGTLTQEQLEQRRR